MCRRKARAKKNIKAARMTDRLTTATLRVRRLMAKTKSVCVGLSVGDRTDSKMIPKIRTKRPSALTETSFMIRCRDMVNIRERKKAVERLSSGGRGDYTQPSPDHTS